jgi:peptidyl-prolyl cis-trans isomerase D
MLHLMRKHAGSWMIKIILFAIVVVFVFWGVGSMRSRKANRVADINGEIISQDMYQQAYYRLLENYRRIYGDQYNDALLKMLRPNETVLNQLVNTVVMLQEAERLGIGVGEEELASSIRQIPDFQNNGAFDYRRYNLLLTQNNITPEQFESDQKDQIIIDKLRAVVLSGVTVTEDEVRQWYDWSNARINLSYVLFSPDRYQNIQPSQSEIQSYFQEHKEDYRTQPRIKVRYLYFNPEVYEAQVKIGDERIAEYYQGHPAEFKTDKRVKARHILIKVDEGADEKTVETKKDEALKVYKMASAGKDKNFAVLAKKFSQGPTKDKGGELGWFTRDKMVEPFAEKAFSMQAGEISEPVRTRFGWHIIKVEQIEEASTTTLKAASDGIRQKLTYEKAKELAFSKVEAVYDSVFDGDDLGAAGQAHQVPALTTDFFTAAKGPTEKQIGQPMKFAQIAFGLEKMAISEIQDLDNGYYLLQVTDREEAVVPPLEQVAAKVKEDLVKARQDKQAQADAQEFLKSIREGKSLAEASAGLKLEPKETGFFSRSGAIPQIGYEPQIQQDAFELTVEKPLMENAVKGRQGWFVLRLKDWQAPDDAGFDKNRASIMKRLTEQKKKAAFGSWLDDLKSRSKIEINRDLTKM